jgi:hypothetical protein
VPPPSVSLRLAARLASLGMVAATCLPLVTAATLGCRAGKREAAGAVYYRTVPLSAAGADSLEEALLGQPAFALLHAGSTGAPGAARRGVVLLAPGRAGAVERGRVVAWLRARPEVAAAGVDSAGVW